MNSVRQMLGTFIYDWPRMIWALTADGRWLRMRNRNDAVSASPDGTGVRCDWLYTRSLHLCSVFPSSGRRLLRRAIHDRALLLKDRPEYVSRDQICCNARQAGDAPDVSFLIGHRGMARLPLLLATLRSIAAQEELSFECIVVEQDEAPNVQGSLPDWIKYVHTSPMAPDLPYNRSKAFNDGARVACGRMLILHDNDILVPACYAAESIRRHEEGYDVSQLKRFIFYLSESSSRAVCTGDIVPQDGHCVMVLENACGGSLAVSAQAYREMGGMDESFVGWGGEDNEFWDRCTTQKVWEYASLPFVHLWHTPIAEERSRHGNAQKLEAIMSVDAVKRIEILRRRQE